VLTVSDLEVNVLEFRQRSFQFQGLTTVGDREIARFSRTETETESQFRPRLVHLHLLVPFAWVVFDEANDVLLMARDGRSLPARVTEQVIEVGAERTEFEEQGISWKRVSGPPGSFVYAPSDLADSLLSRATYTALGIE